MTTSSSTYVPQPYDWQAERAQRLLNQEKATKVFTKLLLDAWDKNSFLRKIYVKSLEGKSFAYAEVRILRSTDWNAPGHALVVGLRKAFDAVVGQLASDTYYPKEKPILALSYFKSTLGGSYIHSKDGDDSDEQYEKYLRSEVRACLWKAYSAAFYPLMEEVVWQNPHLIRELEWTVGQFASAQDIRYQLEVAEVELARARRAEDLAKAEVKEFTDKREPNSLFTKREFKKQASLVAKEQRLHDAVYVAQRVYRDLSRGAEKVRDCVTRLLSDIQLGGTPSRDRYGTDLFGASDFERALIRLNA